VGITFYTPPPEPHDEDERSRAVIASGALEIIDDPELNRLVERARASLGTSVAAVSIVHQEWQYLIATAGLKPGVYSRRTSFCGHTVVASDEIFLVPDAGQDARFAGNPAVVDGMLRFYVGAVLRDDHGQPLGALCAFDPLPRAGVTQRQEQQFRDLAAAVMVRLEELREFVSSD
jgi:GAF domain-containing protein